MSSILQLSHPFHFPVSHNLKFVAATNLFEFMVCIIFFSSQAAADLQDTGKFMVCIIARFGQSLRLCRHFCVAD